MSTSRSISRSVRILLLLACIATHTTASGVNRNRNHDRDRDFVDEALVFVDTLAAVFNGTATSFADLESLVDVADFVWSPKPASVGGGLELGWDAYTEQQAASLAAVGGFSAFAVEFTAEPAVSRKRVVLFATSVGVRGGGEPYGQEFVLTFRFNSRGKVVAFEQFVDSLYTFQTQSGSS